MAAAAPPPRKLSPAEDVALQQAGQYAGRQDQDILTSVNAPAAGLDPEQGFINPKFGVSEPPPGTWNPVPQLKQILETPVPGIPSFLPSQQTVPPGTPTYNPLPILKQIAETKIPGTSDKKEIKIPGATEIKEDAPSDSTSSGGFKVPGTTEIKDQPDASAAPIPPQKGQILIQGSTEVPEEQTQPPPQTQAATTSPAPPTTYPTVARDQPDTQEQIRALVEQGHSPGAAQAVAGGNVPRTLSGNVPPPPAVKVTREPAPQTTTVIAPPPVGGEAQPHKPVDTLQAGKNNAVDPVQLYSYLLGKFANSGLVGYVPPDGAQWGIKTGSAAEWAAFGLAVAKQESDLNTKSWNPNDPGGSAGLFQFGQGQKPFVQGDQFNPQQSADAFVRSVQHYLGNKGSVANMGETFGSIRRPNEAGQYIAGAQKVAAGGSGKDLVSSGGGGSGGGPSQKEAPSPEISLPSAKDSSAPLGFEGGTGYRGGGSSSGGGGGGGGQRNVGSLDLFPGGGGGGGGQSQQAQDQPQASRQSMQVSAPLPDQDQQNPMVKALVDRGFTPQQALQFAQSSANVAPGKGIGPLTVKGPPPAAPTSQFKLVSPKQLMPHKVPKLGPPAAPSAPSAKAPLQLNAPPPAPSAPTQAKAPPQQPARTPVSPVTPQQQAPARQPQQAQALPPPAPPPKDQPKPQPKAQPQPEPEPTVFTGRPAGSTHGDPNPKGLADTIQKWPRLKDQALQHAALLSDDDPRVKKQKDGLVKGEHFVEGDPFHDQLLDNLPHGKQGRQRGLLGQAETAIGDKQPMHISYISAPKEAEKFPTRDTRKVQYDESSPEARLMGTTEGQLVGHSLIPLNVGVKLSAKGSEPHQSYIQGLSTNVLANNFQHLNDKIAAMGRKTPYKELGTKFANDLEGYFHNLLAGHTATGSGYTVGTEHHPNEPDREHVPYKLSRKEADFIGAAINNDSAFAKHEDAAKIRELARANGTLITPEGETNRLRHDIETHEPGWRKRMLEPTIRSFKTGLIHEIHPSEEHLPQEIRPGKGYQQLTKALARTSERGRPDIPVGASLHHTFQDNAAINKIERDFSEHKIDEAEARNRITALGEDPDDYRFVGGSGGLITPYEDDPEALTPEEHTQMKDNLRQQWVGGKLGVDDYRKKAAEVPLPSKPSKPKAVAPVETPEAPPVPKPLAPKPPKPPKPKAPPSPEPEDTEAPEPEEETPTPAPKPKKAAPPAVAPAPDEPLPEKKPAKAAKSYPSEDDIKSTAIRVNGKDVYPGETHMDALDAYQEKHPEHTLDDPNEKEEGIFEHATGKKVGDWEHGYQTHGGDFLNSKDVHDVNAMRSNAIRMHDTGKIYEGPSHIVAHYAAQRAGEKVRKPEGGTNYDIGYMTKVGDFTKERPKTQAKPPAAPPAPDEPLPAKKPESAKPVTVPEAPKTTGPVEKPSWKTANEKTRQAYLKKRVAQDLEKQYKGPDAHPLEVDRNDDKSIKYDPSGNPIYKKIDYDLANSPLLKKKGLNQIKDADKHEDTLGNLIGPDGKEVIDPETGKPVLKHAHLNQTERRRLSAMHTASAVHTMGNKIVDEFMKIKDIPEIAAGEGWYSRMREKLAAALGEHHELFAQLLGATSAKTPVRNNFIQSLDALEQFKSGKFDNHIKKYLEGYEKMREGKGALVQHMKNQGIPLYDKDGNTVEHHENDAAAMANWIHHHGILPRQQIQPGQEEGSKYNANSIAVLKALAGTWLKEVGAPKTPNFAGNLTGRTLEATIDVWAARFLKRLGYEGHGDGPWRSQGKSEPGVNSLDFAFSQDAMRHAADEITRRTGKKMNPDDLQAIAWFAEKHHWEKQGWTRGAGAEKSSFDDVADLAFPKTGEPMTSADLRKHYAAIQEEAKRVKARVKTAKTYVGHANPKMRAKLEPYMEKHGLTHEQVHGPEVEEEDEDEAA